jgi:hypothetical protein
VGVQELFQLTSWRSSERSGDLRHVGDDGLDAVALALHFGNEAGHLVPGTDVMIFEIFFWQIIGDLIHHNLIFNFFAEDWPKSPKNDHSIDPCNGNIPLRFM